MAKSKKSFIVFILPLLIALLTLGNQIFTAKAFSSVSTGKNAQVLISDNYVSNLCYNNGSAGLKLSFMGTGEENAVVFNNYLDLSSDKIENVLSFAVEPDKVNENNVGNVIVRLKDVSNVSNNSVEYSGKFVDIKISSYNSERDNSGIVDVFARACNGDNKQDFGGETIDGSIRFGNYGSVRNVSFAGKNTNVLDIKYQNKKVLATPVYGSYSETVRDLSKDYGIDNDYLFDGFGDKVEVSIFIDWMKKDNAKANIIIFSLGGQEVISPLSANVPSLGVVNKAYLIPELLVWNNGFSTATNNFEYKIYSPNNQLFSNGTSNSENRVTFTPVEAGKYVVEYFFDGKSTRVTIEVLSKKDSQDEKFVFTGYEKEFHGFNFPNDKITVGASAMCDLDLLGSTVKVYAKLTDINGNIKTYIDVTNDNADINLPQEIGDYKLTYEAVNYVGDKIVTDDIVISVKAETVNFVGDIDEIDYVDYSLERTNSIFNPSKNDIEIFDSVLGKVDDYVLAIRIKEPETNTFVNTSNFKKVGEYLIEYSISYGGKNIVVKRVLNIYDSVKPIFEIEGEFSSTKLDDVKSSTNETIYLRALKNSTCEFPIIKAKDPSGEKNDLTESILYFEKKPLSPMVDKTEKFSIGDYSVTFNEKGIYYFKFEVEDASGLSVTKTYVVDVRDYWYSLSIPNEVDKQQNTDGVIVSGFFVKDFNWQTVDGANIFADIYLYDQIVKNDAYGKIFTDLKPGDYKVKVYAEYNGESTDEFIYNFSIIDNTPPKITLKNLQKTGKTGKTIKLAEYEISDNDLIENVIIKLYFDGAEINFCNNQFYAENVGKYTVSYTVIDISGNQTVEEYEINVEKDLIVLIVICISLGVIVISGVVILVILKKKKHNKGV